MQWDIAQMMRAITPDARKRLYEYLGMEERPDTDELSTSLRAHLAVVITPAMQRQCGSVCET